MKRERTIDLDAGDDGSVRLAAVPMGVGDRTLDPKDLEAGLFKDVSIITRGPAIGHGFDIDDVTLQQVADSINRHEGGVAVHITHPDPGGWFTAGTDGIMCLIGHAGDGGGVRVEDGQVRGDIQLGEFAHHVPGSGDVWKFLTGVAKARPDAIGLSIRFIPDEFEERQDENDQSLPPAARVKDVLAVDFVGDPGANPDGLLSEGEGKKRNQTSGQGRPRNRDGDPKMNDALKKFLITIGLAADATDEQATKFLAELTDENQKQIAEALKTKAATPTKDLATGDDDEPPVGAVIEAAVAKAVAANVERLKSLRGIAESAGLSVDWVNKQFEDNTSIPEAQAMALAEIRKNRQGVATAGGGDNVTGGTNRDLASLTPAISDAILLRAGRPLFDFDPESGQARRDENGRCVLRQPHDRAKTFRYRSVVEMMRAHLLSIGVPGVDCMSRSRIVSLSMNRQRRMDEFAGVSLASTGDFPFILADAMNKTLRAAFEESPRTWNVWARRVTNVDFKDIKRLALGASPDLEEREEGGELRYVTLGESKETYALVEYANGILFTRRAMINDDLDAFDRVPVLQANAAVRKEDDVAYAILTLNANMADGNALFSVAHANIGNPEGAPSVATMGDAFHLMRVQTGIAGEILNIMPRFLLHPVALDVNVRELLTSTANPASNNAGVTNVMQNRFVPVSEPRLDAKSSSAWYVTADPGQHDTVEVCFLEGEETPVANSKVDFDTDDQRFSVRHTVAAKAIDWRGMVRNGGGG